MLCARSRRVSFADMSAREPGRPERPAWTPPDVAITEPDGATLDEVMPVLYEEIRRLARRELRHEATGHTLSTTALAHEAYLELAAMEKVRWKSRAHFFSVCARVIRHVLVDHALHRKAQKRGGGRAPISLDRADQFGAQAPEGWADLDEALTRLAERFPRQARVVECRFFAGMSVEDTAEALEIAPATVKRDWTLARAWLNRELSP
jgi:RNA polymerase sigma factor (TIGR02999 family)